MQCVQFAVADIVFNVDEKKWKKKNWKMQTHRQPIARTVHLFIMHEIVCMYN